MLRSYLGLSLLATTLSMSSACNISIGPPGGNGGGEGEGEGEEPGEGEGEEPGEGEGEEPGEGEGEEPGEGEGEEPGEGEGEEPGEGEGEEPGEGEGEEPGEGEGEEPGEGEGEEPGEGEGEEPGEGEGEGEEPTACEDTMDCTPGKACLDNVCVVGTPPGADCELDGIPCARGDFALFTCESLTGDDADATCRQLCGDGLEEDEIVRCSSPELCNDRDTNDGVAGFCVPSVASNEACDAKGIVNVCSSGTCAPSLGGVALCTAECSFGGASCGNNGLCVDEDQNFSGACQAVRADGEECDLAGLAAPCGPRSTCVGSGETGRCTPDATCARPLDLNLYGATGNPTLLYTTGNLSGAGDDDVAGLCSSPEGADELWSISVTERSEVIVYAYSSDSDLVVYVRSDCSDLGSEFACNDVPENQEVRFTRIPLGVQDAGTTFHVTVDQLRGGSNRSIYYLAAELLPVRERDEACEPGSASERCDEGLACSSASRTCVATVCGDGVREGTEECDDGGEDTGDGCDARCNLELLTETEPNDFYETPNALGPNAGAVGVDNNDGNDNDDNFSVLIPPGFFQALRLVLTTPEKTCFPGQPSYLDFELFDREDNRIAFDNTASDCGLIQTDPLPPGTYRVRVNLYGGAVPYRLTVERRSLPVLPPDSRCDVSGAENRCGAEVLSSNALAGTDVTITRTIPAGPGIGSRSCGGSGRGDFWRFTAPEDGLYEVTTTGMDTVIGGLSDCGGNSYECDDRAGANGTDIFSFAIAANQQTVISVSSYDQNGGTYTLKIRKLGPALPNQEPVRPADDVSCTQVTAPRVCSLDTAICAAPTCGDGVVFGGTGEQCDDNNAADGDGCSSACLREIAAESEGNNSVAFADAVGRNAGVSGVFGANNDQDVYSLSLEGAGTIDVEMMKNPEGYCDFSNSTTELRDTDGRTVLGEVDGCGLMRRVASNDSCFTALNGTCDEDNSCNRGTDATDCGRVVLSERSLLPAGTYYLFVRSTTLSQDRYQVLVNRRLAPVRADGEVCDVAGAVDTCAAGLSCIATTARCAEPVCGDGVVNVDGEECDDNNTANGDGCSARCAREVVQDAEPNGSFADAQDLGVLSLLKVSGNVQRTNSTVDPDDYYQFKLDGAAFLSLKGTDSAGTCLEEGALALYTEDGTLLGRSRFGDGPCPVVSANTLGAVQRPGTYYLLVQTNRANGENYVLDLFADKVR